MRLTTTTSPVTRIVSLGHTLTLSPCWHATQVDIQYLTLLIIVVLVRSTVCAQNRLLCLPHLPRLHLTARIQFIAERRLIRTTRSTKGPLQCIIGPYTGVDFGQPGQFANSCLVTCSPVWAKSRSEV